MCDGSKNNKNTKDLGQGLEIYMSEVVMKETKEGITPRTRK